MLEIDNSSNEQLLSFTLEQKNNIIKVLGVGGGGGNAVNHMYETGIDQVDFIIANTDNQALAASKIPIKIQLGVTLTQGLGAGNNPQHGMDAAAESTEEIKRVLVDGNTTKMLFVTAGMGGGTGTGAAPVIAAIAKEMQILTIGIVTIPFRFEGPKRVKQALAGIDELKKNVDSLLVIDNEKIKEMYGKLTLKEAFTNADNVLTLAAKGIADIITCTGSVNVDFADVKSVMQNSGVALMGAGRAEGEDRAIRAIQMALNSPLLNNNDITGAKNVLVNIASSPEYEAQLDEVSQINEYVQNAAGNSSDLIWGSSLIESLGETICVTLIATGFEAKAIPNPYDNGNTYKPNLANISLPNNSAEKKTNDVNSVSQSADIKEEEKPAESKPEESVAVGQTVEFEEEQDNSDASVEPEDEDDEEVVIESNSFKKLNYNTAAIINEYEQTPAYQRKGVKLNIGNYTEGKFQKFPLNEE